MTGDLERLKHEAQEAMVAAFGSAVCTCAPGVQRPERRIRGPLVGTVCRTCGGRVGTERGPVSLEAR